MRFRNGSTLAALAAGALLVTACAGGQDAGDQGNDADPPEAAGEEAAAESSDEDGPSGERVLIGYAPSELDPTDFFGMFQLGLEQGLEERGVDYELRAQAPPSPTGHTEQFNFVEELVTLGADIIVIAPTEYEAQISAYQAVNDAGIPLFLTNISRPEDPPGDFEVVQYSAFSHEEGAIANAEWFVENLEPDTNIAILRGLPGEVDDQRALPVIEELEANGFNIVAQEVADFDRDKGFRATQDLLSAHPEIEFIYSVNSGMAAGALAAIETAGLTPNEDVKVWGYGGNMEELEAIVADRQAGSVYRDPVEMGDAMAEGIWLTLQGREDEVEPEFLATMQVVASCPDIVEIVPEEAFGGEFEKPTMDDCT